MGEKVRAVEDGLAQRFEEQKFRMGTKPIKRMHTEAMAFYTEDLIQSAFGEYEMRKRTAHLKSD